MSVDPEIFAIFQHKVERIPHFVRVTEVRLTALLKSSVLGAFDYYEHMDVRFSFH